MASASAKKLAAELTTLAADSAQLDDARARRVLSDALASQHAELAARAAKLITEHMLHGFEPELRAAFRAFCGERASSVDPGALAKEALIGALEALEDGDAELFAEAARYVQLDRVQGGLRDRAAGVRARAALALARVGHADLLPIVLWTLTTHATHRKRYASVMQSGALPHRRFIRLRSPREARQFLLDLAP